MTFSNRLRRGTRRSHSSLIRMYQLNGISKVNWPTNPKPHTRNAVPGVTDDQGGGPLARPKSKVAVQSTLLTPRPNRFTRALPPRGSRDLLRLAEGGALPYEGARHCPGFSLQTQDPRPLTQAPASPTTRGVGLLFTKEHGAKYVYLT